MPAWTRRTERPGASAAGAAETARRGRDITAAGIRLDRGECRPGAAETAPAGTCRRSRQSRLPGIPGRGRDLSRSGMEPPGEDAYIPAGHRAGIWRRAGTRMPTGADADTTALRKASYVGTARRRRTITISFSLSSCGAATSSAPLTFLHSRGDAGSCRSTPAPERRRGAAARPSGGRRAATGRDSARTVAHPTKQRGGAAAPSPDSAAAGRGERDARRSGAQTGGGE
jgi:hypothetical protein